MNEFKALIAACNLRTKAFYGTLLGLVVLDILLLSWLFSPFAHASVSRVTAPPVAAISDVAKPSPFELREAKATRRRAAVKPKAASAGLVNVAY